MRKFFENSSIYFISNLINKVIYVLFFAYIARVLSIQEMGQYSIYILIVTFLSIICSFEIQSGFTRFYFEVTEVERRKYEISIVNLLFIINLVFAVILFSFRQLIINYLFYIPLDIFFVMLILPFFISFSGLITSKLRLENMAFELSIITVVQAAANLILVVTGIKFFALTDKIFWILFACFLQYLIPVSCYFFVFEHKWKFKIDFSLIKDSLTFSSYLVPTVLGNHVSHMADRFILKKYTGIKSVGIYSAANKVGSIIMLVLEPIYLAFFPIVLKSYKQEGFKRNYYFMCMSIFFILYLITVLISIFCYEIMYIILGKKYLIYMPVAYLFIMVWTVRFASRPFASNISLAKKTEYSLFIELFTAVTNIILNILLVIKLGISGAIIATMISFILRLILLFYFSNKLLKIFYFNFRYILLYLIVVALHIFFHYKIKDIFILYRAVILFCEAGLGLFVYMKIIDVQYRQKIFEYIDIYKNKIVKFKMRNIF
ncbi:MAG: polysaccharide biosynthesis protein [bacterium]|nr:polysaccharide biosynthesis protein [bacterium]